MGLIEPILPTRGGYSLYEGYYIYSAILEGTHYMKVTTYTPPFRPLFQVSWKFASIVSTPMYEGKWGKCISTPFFCQTLAKCIVSTHPLFLHFESTGGAQHPYPKPNREPTHPYFSFRTLHVDVRDEDSFALLMSTVSRYAFIIFQGGVIR